MKDRIIEFFRPDGEKVALASVLFVLGAILPNLLFSYGGFHSLGIPAPIYFLTSVVETLPPEPQYSFFLSGTAFNAVFWYLVGGINVNLYRKLRERNSETGDKE
jgi:hypothetical protein